MWQLFYLRNVWQQSGRLSNDLSLPIPSASRNWAFFPNGYSSISLQRFCRRPSETSTPLPRWKRHPTAKDKRWEDFKSGKKCLFDLESYFHFRLDWNLFLDLEQEIKLFKIQMFRRRLTIKQNLSSSVVIIVRAHG